MSVESAHPAPTYCWTRALPDATLLLEETETEEEESGWPDTTAEASSSRDEITANRRLQAEAGTTRTATTERTG
jgi:hypothetical protein